MKCKDCKSCKKGWFSSRPDVCICIGVKVPFIIKDVNAECVMYSPYTKEELVDKFNVVHCKEPNWSHCHTTPVVYNATVREPDEWIPLYEVVPPLNEEVELKVIINGEERIYINKLIPMMSGKYIWSYCDYDGYEVVGWRRKQNI